MYPQSSPRSETPTASSSMAPSVHARLSELPHEPKLTPGADQLSTCPYQRAQYLDTSRARTHTEISSGPPKGRLWGGGQGFAILCLQPQGGGGDAEQRLSPEKEMCHGAPLPGLARQEQGSNL